MSPVIATPHHYLVSIFRNQLYFVAVLTNECKKMISFLEDPECHCESLVAPLFVIEFLHHIMDVFEDYFNECTESSLKDNYVIVYEVRLAFLAV